MATAGPIIIVEDDADDKDIFEDVLKEIGIANTVVWFTRSDAAISYLQTTTEQPFIIFSDVNLPMENGIDFKRRIDSDHELRKKSIPFVFYSTSIDQNAVNEAYTQMTVQGYFQKGNSFDEMKRNIKIICDYWLVCRHPNVK